MFRRGFALPLGQFSLLLAQRCPRCQAAAPCVHEISSVIPVSIRPRAALAGKLQGQAAGPQ